MPYTPSPGAGPSKVRRIIRRPVRPDTPESPEIQDRPTEDTQSVNEADDTRSYQGPAILSRSALLALPENERPSHQAYLGYRPYTNSPNETPYYDNTLGYDPNSPTNIAVCGEERTVNDDAPTTMRALIWDFLRATLPSSTATLPGSTIAGELPTGAVLLIRWNGERKEKRKGEREEEHNEDRIYQPIDVFGAANPGFQTRVQVLIPPEESTARGYSNPIYHAYPHYSVYPLLFRQSEIPAEWHDERSRKEFAPFVDFDDPSERSTLAKSLFEATPGTVTVVDLCGQKKRVAVELAKRAIELFTARQNDMDETAKLVMIPKVHRLASHWGNPPTLDLWATIDLHTTIDSFATKLANRILHSKQEWHHNPTRYIVSTSEPDLVKELINACDIKIVHQMDAGDRVDRITPILRTFLSYDKPPGGQWPINMFNDSVMKEYNVGWRMISDLLSGQALLLPHQTKAVEMIRPWIDYGISWAGRQQTSSHVATTAHAQTNPSTVPQKRKAVALQSDDEVEEEDDEELRAAIALSMRPDEGLSEEMGGGQDQTVEQQGRKRGVIRWTYNWETRVLERQE